ncbi:hypothetical protein FQN49_005680 [Arthroderma sp. PD_2]|nr:hypothetical protein FQN49_005680 [Arthroderma sp. PD_2]
MAGLASLPAELFLIVLLSLDVKAVVCCRAVSKAWYSLFTQPRYLQYYLKRLYPRTRESRLLESGNCVGGTPTHEIRKLFDCAASRYYHLLRGDPRSIKIYSLHEPRQYRALHRTAFYAHQSQSSSEFFQPEDTLPWAYDDGILVYQPDNKPYLMFLDIEWETSHPLPFSLLGKPIRNIRIQCKIIVIEWVKIGPGNEAGHFAAAFDITGDSFSGHDTVFLGTWCTGPLSTMEIDEVCFHSSHNRHHYALYTGASGYVEFFTCGEGCLDGLKIWDISDLKAPDSHSDCIVEPDDRKMSDDYWGFINAPMRFDPRQSSSYALPPLVAEFNAPILRFYDSLEMIAPTLQGLSINSESGIVDIVENIFHGEAYEDEDVPYDSTTIVTSIPFIGHGPWWRREVQTHVFPYRGHDTLESSPLKTRAALPYLHVAEVFDDVSGVGFRLSMKPREQGGGGTPEYVIYIDLPGHELDVDGLEMEDDLGTIIGDSCKIRGDERILIGQYGGMELFILRFDRPEVREYLED